MENDLLMRISSDIGELTGKVDGINRRLDITNGRIAKNENSLNEMELRVIYLNGQAEHEKQKEVRTQSWKDYWLKAVVGFSLTVAGAIIMIVLQKIDIVNLSILPPDEYKKVDNITEPYENR